VDRRIEKINNLLQELLAQMILKEFCQSRDIIISLTRVETTDNLTEAKVFISVIPNEKRQPIVAALNKEVYFFQGLLNKKLKMRPVPKIAFYEDVQPVKAEEVEKILADIDKDKPEANH